MLDFNGCILLANAILIDHKVFTANIGNKVPVRILYEHFDRYNFSPRVKVDLCFLLTLLALKKGPVRSIRYLNLSFRRRLHYQRARSQAR